MTSKIDLIHGKDSSLVSKERVEDILVLRRWSSLNAVKEEINESLRIHPTPARYLASKGVSTQTFGHRRGMQMLGS
jgi:hypothetical protein